MRVTTLLNKLLNLPGLWVRGVRFEDAALIIEAHPRFQLLTCPECGTKVSGRFEQKTRSWRHLAIWGMSTHIEAPIRRLRCPECSKVQTEAVPWARHRSTFTRPFEDVVGLLAHKLDHTSVAELTGIPWVTVGAIAERLVDELPARRSLRQPAGHRCRRDLLPPPPPLPHRRHRPWISWAQRSRLKPFVGLARTIRKHIDGILAFIDSRLTNARLEGMNNKIRLLSHRAYGFHSAEPLIAMVYLCFSKITLPAVQLV